MTGTTVQWRGGDQAAVDAFTGAAREVVVNTDTQALVVQDGVTAGGFEQARADLSNVLTSNFTTSASIASATTTDLGTVAGNTVLITGTTTIEAFGSSANAAKPLFYVRFNDALQLTHNASSLIIPGGANLTTAAGDCALLQYLTGGNWRVAIYQKANGEAIVGAGSDVITSDSALGLDEAMVVADGTARKVQATPNTINSSTGLITMAGGINLAAAADVASATTTNIGAANSNTVRITGTTTITAFDTVAAGIRRSVYFADALTLTHNGTSLILPGGSNITTAANDSAEFLSLGSGNWLCLDYKKQSGTSIAGGSGSTLQVFTASVTWTKPAGLSSVLVTVISGGGGGGGSAAGPTGSCGGGGGGAAVKRVAAGSLGATETVTVGAAGGAGSGTNSGTAGGTSSFGAHCSVTGGAGGTYNALGDITGGAASGGDINLTGGNGGYFTSIGGGNGGNSALGYGQGGLGGINTTSGRALAAEGYGGGGGGSLGSTAGTAGGAGTAGIIIVQEFY